MKIGYHLALRWARLKRASYTRRLAGIAARPFPAAPDSGATYYSFSGTRDLPEQVACLRSFLRNAASPARIVIVGDGTHSASDVAVLKSIHPRLETRPWHEFIRTDLPEPMMAYARNHPLGKKVAVLMSVPLNGPWIFSDSDILYFEAASDIRARLEKREGGLDYLQDCYPSLDDRLVTTEAEKANPVNSGFAIVHGALNWSVALDRFASMKGDSGYFTEQTLFHLAVRNSGGKPLPMDRYVIQSDDQWVGGDRYSGPGVVLRHYFSSIRYKMWLKTPLTG